MEVHLVTPLVGRLTPTIEVYPFREDVVNLIPTNIQYGIYRIGVVQGDEFRVKYFGRSDCNSGGLRQRISDHLPEYNQNYYFWWSSKPNVEEAYKAECCEYHTYFNIDGRKLNGNGIDVDNIYHPAKPAGLSIKCIFPLCNK